MLRKRIATLLMGTILVGTLAVGCSSDEGSNGGVEQTTITVSGSTSVGPSMESLAEEFEAQNEGIRIEVQQLGSSAGIKNAIDGISEIGMSSRDLKDEEKASGLIEHEIAIDGISVIVNSDNEVEDLSLDQLRGIYTGEITNWSEVGGADAPIVVVSREDGSGTRDGFQDTVGFDSEELTGDAQIGDGSGNIKSTVEGNQYAIGYISYAYVDDAVKALTIDGVESTEENIASKTYAIQRPFIIVNTEEGLSEAGQNFIDFILSAEGQEIIESKGLVKIN